jgi:hypothetical protein
MLTNTSPARVWVSNFPQMGLQKVGLRHKYHGQAWQEPYVRHVVPRRSPEQKKSSQRYALGYVVPPEEHVQASAVYDHACFAKQSTYCFAGIGYLVDEKVAEIMRPFDRGSVGLVDHPIFEADEKTPITDKWFRLGLGVQKRSVLPEKSTGLDLLWDGGQEKDSLFCLDYNPKDNAIAVSKDALAGSDMWNEAEVKSAIFLSDGLGQALVDAGLRDALGITSVKVKTRHPWPFRK